MDNSASSDKYQSSGQNGDSDFFWYIISFISWTLFIALQFYSFEYGGIGDIKFLFVN